MSDPDGQQRLSDDDEQLWVLQKFVEMRQTLRLRVSGDQQDYSTIILFCDQSQRELIVDQALSSTEQLPWSQHSVVNLDGTVAGVHYELINLAVREQPPADGIGHRVAFPQQILSQQRRQAFRCPIPRSFPTELTVTIPDTKTPLRGRVLDFSATGLACECELPEKADTVKLENLKSELVSVELRLNDLLSVICSAELKEILPNSREPMLRFGLEFHDLSPSLQRKLDKAVADLQRLTRNNQLV